MNNSAENLLPETAFQEQVGGNSNPSGYDQVADNIRPIPRISVQAFCETQGLTEVMEMGALDRRMDKAHVKVHSGGIPAATQFYAQAPTPNLLILESIGSGEQIIEQLDMLSGHCDPGTKVIVIGHENDVQLYRELITRGVSEYMIAPVSLSAILAEISAIFVDPDAEPLGRFVAFIGAKGGVGSSTVAHNISWAMSTEIETDVVLADMDVAFGTANIDFDQDPSQHIGDVIFSPDRLDETYLERVLTKCSDHLSLLAAPSTLDNTCDFGEATFDGLFDLLQKGVPYITLDMPHTWTAWTRRVLNRADDIVITATPDLACLRNTKLLLDKLSDLRPNDRSPFLVLNQVGMPKRPEISVAEFTGPLGLEPAAVLPFNPEVFGTASNNGQMIAEFSAKHESVAEFANLAGVLTGRKTLQRNGSSSGLAPLLAKLGLGAKKS